MNTREQQLLKQEVGNADVRMQLRTGTKVDTGHWWWRRRLWLVITDTQLILLAVGRRQYCEYIALSDCSESFYNPASGELVIAPENSLRFPRLKTPASSALKVIELIQSTSPTPNTPSP